MQPPITTPCPSDCPNRIIPPEVREVSFVEKILRYIPGPLIMAWATLAGVFNDSIVPNQLILYWVTFFVILILCPLYVLYRPNFIVFLGEPPSRKFHAIAAPVAFTVWVFQIGGPFAMTWPDTYRPIYGTVLLVLTTLTIPVIERLALKLPFFATKS